MKLRRLLHALNLLVAALLMLAVWVMVTWIGSRPAFKRLWDFSPQARFSVEPVTAELLRGLGEKGIRVEVHTFYQPILGMPAEEEPRQRAMILRRLQDLTTDLLRQYEFLGGDSLRVVHHDLYGDIAGTRAATQQFGVTTGDTVVVAVEIAGRPMRHKRLSLEGDLGVVELPGFGSDTAMGRPNLPVLKDYKGEEALSSALKSLLVQGVPVVYVVRDLSLGMDLDHMAMGSSYGQFFQALRNEGFDLRTLDLRTAVPKDATAVAILEPRREFTEQQARSLFDYLRRGGRVFLNYSFVPTQDWNPDGGELGKLLGFSVGAQAVFHLIPDPRNPDNPGLDNDPSVEKLDIQEANPNHPVTKPIVIGRRALQFAAARELRAQAAAGAGVRTEDLLRTGPYSWLATLDETGHPSLVAPRRRADQFGSRTVALVCDVDGEEQGTSGHLVVASGLFCNNAGLRINGDLALNIFNWFAERRELVTVRGDRYKARSLQASKQQLDRAWWLLVVAVPGLMLAAGLFIAWRRSRT